MIKNALTLRNCTLALICTKAWDNMDDVAVNGVAQFSSNYQKGKGYEFLTLPTYLIQYKKLNLRYNLKISINE